MGPGVSFAQIYKFFCEFGRLVKFPSNSFKEKGFKKQEKQQKNIEDQKKKK